MALPNPAMSFSPFAILTAEEQNNLVENIEALADGSAFDPATITSDKLSIGQCSYNGELPPGQTSSSTSYLTIGSATASITTTGGALLLMLSVPAYITANEVYCALQINGIDYKIASTSNTAFVGSIVGYGTIAAGVVPAGTYTVVARAKVVTSGTYTLKQYETVSFAVVEI